MPLEPSDLLDLLRLEKTTGHMEVVTDFLDAWDHRDEKDTPVADTDALSAEEGIGSDETTTSGEVDSSSALAGSDPVPSPDVVVPPFHQVTPTASFTPPVPDEAPPTA